MADRSKIDTSKPWTTPNPPSETYLSPPDVASIPTKHSSRTNDHPVASATKSAKTATYFTETDSYYVPASGKDSPALEVWVSWYDNPTERGELPEEFWDFRESAVKELLETGRLHWRETDRWGRGWHEENMGGDRWPTWNDKEGRWDLEGFDG